MVLNFAATVFSVLLQCPVATGVANSVWPNLAQWVVTQPMGQLGQAEFVVTIAVSYYRVLLYALKFSPIQETEPELDQLKSLDLGGC
jgi:hypothetical protein